MFRNNKKIVIECDQMSMKSSEYRVNTFYIFHKIASERAVHIFADRGFTRGEEHLLVKKIKKQRQHFVCEKSPKIRLRDENTCVF